MAEDKVFLLGDEAVAQGALDGGMSGCYAYPGTPSTEIMEYVQASRMAAERGVQREWSANEKTAMEAALGMSYAGKRAMVCMKHVGLNVAADPFMNAAITGVNGGVVVVVADDPSMHSSQNEQDSRYYGKFARIPVLEPSNQQEAYDMAREGFALSESFGVPVLIRLVTRLAHSRTAVRRAEILPENKVHLPGDLHQFILLPAMARRRNRKLLSQQPAFEEAAERSEWNTLKKSHGATIGIIACGLAINYVMEALEGNAEDYNILKISQYPAPIKQIRELMNKSEQVYLFEEGYPLLEEQLRGILGDVHHVSGRMNGTLPPDGELNPNLVARALGKPYPQGIDRPEVVKGRPPSFCPGCGHVDVYRALNDALGGPGSGRVFSDIGCYTLGALPPYDAINSCVDMGASVTMAVGAADAGLEPAVAVIGDSTFTHSGMTGLLDAVDKGSNITLIISDNSATAMTGGQKPAGLDKIEKICLGLGVEPDHVRTVVPLRKNHDENVRVMKEEIGHKGVSVIVARRECVRVAAKRKRQEKAETKS